MDVIYSLERFFLLFSYLYVIEILFICNFSIVLIVLENGFISTWDVEIRQLFRQIIIVQFVILGMKFISDEKYFVVVIINNILLIYDNVNSCFLFEVEIKGIKYGSGFIYINGFILSVNYVFVWFEVSKDVIVIDLFYGWFFYQFYCWYEVICVQCFLDGVYAFCGQYLNITIIFYLGSGEKLCTVIFEFLGGFVKFFFILDIV